MKLSELAERTGARVHLARADVARIEELAGVLDEAARRMPPLRGVIHAHEVEAHAERECEEREEGA